MKLLHKIPTKKALSIGLIVTLLAVPPLSNLTLPFTHAAALEEASLRINNSQSGASGVTYTLSFTTPATTAIGRWVVQFCTTPSGACTTPTGMTTTGAAIDSDNIAGTGRSNTFGANGTLDTDVTTEAAQADQNVVINYTGITNPSTTNTTFYARVTTYIADDSTPLDTATLAAATLESTSIALSASVDPNFTFSVAGVASSGSVNSETTTVTTTSTTVPFGTLTADTPSVGAHDLTVTTNAGSGYTITASHSATIAGDPPLVSGNNNIDAFTGTNTTPTVWSGPAGSTANTNTGFFGYTTEDTTLCTGTANRFDGNEWAGSSILGQEVACSTTGVDTEITRIGYQTEVNSIQPAGSYTGTVILIATPTY